jgi:DNA primase
MMVEELIKAKGLDYKLTNKDYVIKCLNPEHDDNNPSMHVDKVTGVYHCWSCGFSGNIYKYFGLEISVLGARQQSLLEKIRDVYYTRLEIPTNAVPFNREYRGISASTYNKFNAFVSSDFENRVVFPIYNISDEISAFVARSLISSDKQRYLMSPNNAKIPLFPAKIKPIQNTLILVEGLFDMLNLYDKGLHNVVCMFGLGFGVSKNLNKKRANLVQLEPYKLQGVTKILIMTDGDAPGRQAATKMYNTFSQDYLVDVIDLPDDTDPGDLTQTDVNLIKREYYA